MSDQIHYSKFLKENQDNDLIKEYEINRLIEMEEEWEKDRGTFTFAETVKNILHNIKSRFQPK